MMDHNAVLIATAEAYMLAVKRLGEESGYNRLTYFEAPILKMSTEEMREEAHERWLELNISGQQLSAAVNAAKLTLNEPQPSAASEPAGWLVERPGDSTFPRLFRNKASADALVEYVNVNPPATSRPVFLNEPQTVKEPAERCLTCGRSDAEYKNCDWTCNDPWHADAHLRRSPVTRPQR